MIIQGRGSLCICDKCKKVITNMEYIGIKSKFPYIKNNSQISSDSRSKEIKLFELCYDCYDEFVKFLYENGYVNENQKIEIMSKKKTTLDDINYNTK